MGYTIAIGELKVDKHDFDGLDSPCLAFTAKTFKHKGSPAFGEPTDHESQRWPAYSVWSDSLTACGLYDLFFIQGRLIGGHPGIRLITKELHDEIIARMDKFRSENPKTKPTYESDDKLDKFYCRAFWLEYWVKWCFENCETPVISNS